MMREFVFLYPIGEFLSTAVHPQRIDLIESTVQRIIAARYRERGYHLNWAFFAYPENTALPDLTRAASFVDLRGRDRIVNVGITFHDMMQHGRYPREGHILQQISRKEPADEVVIAGFHQWDCVDRFARHCFSAGIPTLVDEDLTEVGLARSIAELAENGAFALALPNSGLSVEFSRHARNPFAGADIIGAAREARAGRPWLAQI